MARADNFLFRPVDLVPVAVTLPTGATEDAANGYPAANVLLDTQVFRVWRSLDLTSEALVLDFGSAVTVAGVLVNHANFATVAWAAGDDGTTFPDALGTRSIPTDDLVADRRKGLQRLTMTTPRRYLRLTPSGVLGGASVYELGAVSFLSDLTPLEYNLGFPEFEQFQRLHQVVGFAQVNADGPATLRVALGQPIWKVGAAESHLQFVRRLIAAAKVTPHLFALNRSHDADGTEPYAYLGLIEGHPRHRLHSGQHFGAELVFQEVVE